MVKHLLLLRKQNVEIFLFLKFVGFSPMQHAWIAINHTQRAPGLQRSVRGPRRGRRNMSKSPSPLQPQPESGSAAAFGVLSPGRLIHQHSFHPTPRGRRWQQRSHARSSPAARGSVLRASANWGKIPRTPRGVTVFPKTRDGGQRALVSPSSPRPSTAWKRRRASTPPAGLGAVGASGVRALRHRGAGQVREGPETSEANPPSRAAAEKGVDVRSSGNLGT